jgi:hypothetical protein
LRTKSKLDKILFPIIKPEYPGGGSSRWIQESHLYGIGNIGGFLEFKYGPGTYNQTLLKKFPGGDATFTDGVPMAGIYSSDNNQFSGHTWVEQGNKFGFGMVPIPRPYDFTVNMESEFLMDMHISGVIYGDGVNSVRFGDKVSMGREFPENVNSDFDLGVNEKIVAKTLVVDQIDWTSWPDFVFKKDYKLQSLEKLDSFITENNHLPGVPSAKEIESNGLDVAEMDMILLQKVEELTLYVLDLQSQLNKLK